MLVLVHHLLLLFIFMLLFFLFILPLSLVIALQKAWDQFQSFPEIARDYWSRNNGKAIPRSFSDPLLISFETKQIARLRSNYPDCGSSLCYYQMIARRIETWPRGVSQSVGDPWIETWGSQDCDLPRQATGPPLRSR